MYDCYGCMICSMIRALLVVFKTFMVVMDDLHVAHPRCLSVLCLIEAVLCDFVYAHLFPFFVLLYDFVYFHLCTYVYAHLFT